MKKVHFRIIELPSHQVLIQKDFDNETDEDMYLIVIAFFIEGNKVTHKYSYEKEQNRDDMFELITVEHVHSLIDNANNVFK